MSLYKVKDRLVTNVREQFQYYVNKLCSIIKDSMHKCGLSDKRNLNINMR